MTTAKVKAPIGYHFMVREKDNDFYLMRTIGRYVKHEAGEYVSSLSIDVEVKVGHLRNDTTGQRVATATSVSNRTTTVRTTPTTRTTTVRTPSSGSSSSGSSSSGGGY